MIHRVVFIGAGNLATRLSHALSAKGLDVIQVYSRTAASARNLATQLDSAYTTRPRDIKTGADAYFVALTDAGWGKVLPSIDFGEGLVVHCSGSMPLSALEKYAANRGVLYPLQTFSKNRLLPFQEIPVFVEADSKKNEKILLELAGKISDTVSLLDSEKRLVLHIAAVFACNFVNHFYTLASEILESRGISFDVLKPLIMETAGKVLEMAPPEAQTGPAVRFDQNVIVKHLEALDAFPEKKELYHIISKSIFEHQQKNGL